MVMVAFFFISYVLCELFYFASLRSVSNSSAKPKIKTRNANHAKTHESSKKT